MARLLMLLIFSLIAVTTAKAEDSLETVKKKFASIKSFNASFSQTATTSAGDTHSFEGTIDLSRPAKVRMEITTPEEQLIVYNGERAWLYLPEQNICYVYAAQQLGNLAQMPGYVFDPFGKLSVESWYTTDTCLVIAFNAPEGDPFIKSIDLTISRKSLLPQELLIEDKVGTNIAYRFSTITINGAEEVSFTFVPPEGTEIIEQ
jgi:chaperone LolA